MESYNEKIRNISILIGYINIALQLDSFQDVRDDYLNILNCINEIVKEYLNNNNFNNIKKEEFNDIYDKIDLIREKSYLIKI